MKMDNVPTTMSTGVTSLEKEKSQYIHILPNSAQRPLLTESEGEVHARCLAIKVRNSCKIPDGTLYELVRLVSLPLKSRAHLSAIWEFYLLKKAPYTNLVTRRMLTVRRAYLRHYSVSGQTGLPWTAFCCFVIVVVVVVCLLFFFFFFFFFFSP